MTRGSFGSCDIQRLCNGTRANIVKEIKGYPDKLGLLAGFFDARITYIPVVTLLSISRSFCDAELQEKLKEANIRTDIADKEDAKKRLLESQFAQILANEQIGLLKSRSTIGTDTRKSFTNLASIASRNDRKLNKALAEALREVGLISGYESEVDFGDGLTRRTDLVIECDLGKIRLEVMWRNKTSKAGIANYTLTKLHNYGKALGFLKSVET